MNRRSDILRWFDAGRSPKRAEKLRSRLLGDSFARAELDAMLRVEALLSGEEERALEPLSHFELARIESIVIAKTLTETAAAPGFYRSWKAVAAAVSAVVLLLLLPTIWIMTDRGAPCGVGGDGRFSESLFAPRGGDGPYETHLFLFCVKGEGDEAEITRLDRSAATVGSPDTCDLGGEIQFALTNLTDDYPYLFVFGVDDAGRRLWYFPTPETSESIAVPIGVREHLLGESRVLRINHRSGIVRIVALFSKTPLTDRALSPLIDSLGTDSKSLLSAVDKEGIWLESFLVKLGEGR